MQKKLKHILVVDDDQDIRELLTEILSSEGYGVTAASNGHSALLFLEACIPIELPALMVLDSKMPHMDGAQLIKAIENSECSELRLIPIILSSGLSDEDLRSIPSRVTRIKKPFDLDVMMQTISALS